MSRSPRRAGAVSIAAAAAALVLACHGARAQDALRPAIGRPLQQAATLVDEQRFGEALARIKDAEAAGPRDANERYFVERTRISAALGAGDIETAAGSFDALQGTGLVAPADALRMIEAIAGGYYRAGEFSKAQRWAQRYFGEGGTGGAMQTLIAQSRYRSGDYDGVVRELSSGLHDAERNGTRPSEDRLTLLLGAAAKAGNDEAYGLALRKLVAFHPNAAYWGELLRRLRESPGFAGRLSLDLLRLSLATGSLATADGYTEMAELALQADLPGEAGQVVDKGFAAGVLGTGARAERHERLRRWILKRSKAEEAARAEMLEQARSERAGDALLLAGMKLVYAGQAAKGVELMQAGVAKGRLAQPEEARLHLALAKLAAGDRTGALATLETVQGGSAADLARLWAIHLQGGA